MSILVPIVGPKSPTTDMLDDDAVDKIKIVELINLFGNWRPMRPGGGDCFFRCAVFALLEHSCDPEFNGKRQATFFSLVKTLPDLPPASCEALLMLEKKLNNRPELWSRVPDWINDESSHIAGCLVEYCRCIVAQFLRGTDAVEKTGGFPQLFEFPLSDVIDANFGLDLESFICKEVLSPGTEIEDIVIIALAEAFSLKIHVWVLDTRADGLPLMCLRPSSGCCELKVSRSRAEIPHVSMTLLTNVGNSLKDISKSPGLHFRLAYGRYDLLYGDAGIKWDCFSSICSSPRNIRNCYLEAGDEDMAIEYSGNYEFEGIFQFFFKLFNE